MKSKRIHALKTLPSSTLGYMTDIDMVIYHLIDSLRNKYLFRVFVIDGIFALLITIHKNSVEYSCIKCSILHLPTK